VVKQEKLELKNIFENIRLSPGQIAFLTYPKSIHNDPMIYFSKKQHAMA
jgi:hypothetical protein